MDIDEKLRFYQDEDGFFVAEIANRGFGDWFIIKHTFANGSRVTSHDHTWRSVSARTESEAKAEFLVRLLEGSVSIFG